MSTATRPQHSPISASPASPWDPPPPVLDGASFSPPRSALEEARVGALHRESRVQERSLAHRAQVVAQHTYKESVRRAEVHQLRGRLRRLEDKRDRAEALMRDAVVGGLAVATPLMVAAGSTGIHKELRQAVACAALIFGALAGREWMHHQHERRVDRLDDETERLRGRLTVRDIPQPPVLPVLELG